MAQGRGRRGPPPGRQARGGSARRPARRDGGYGAGHSSRNGGGGAGGGDNTPIIIALAGGGVVAVILIILLVSQGGGGSTPPAPLPQAQPTGGGGAPPRANQPPPPLSAAEKTRVHDMVMRLAQQEPEAVRLKDEGHRAHQAGDREYAQQCWREARDLLQSMIFESETLFESLGSERVELYARSDYRITGKWPKILSEFLKAIE